MLWFFVVVVHSTSPSIRLEWCCSSPFYTLQTIRFTLWISKKKKRNYVWYTLLYDSGTFGRRYNLFWPIKYVWRNKWRRRRSNERTNERIAPEVIFCVCVLVQYAAGFYFNNKLIVHVRNQFLMFNNNQNFIGIIIKLPNQFLGSFQWKVFSCNYFGWFLWSRKEKIENRHGIHNKSFGHSNGARISFTLQKNR